jgi:hypothetical protein
MKKAEELPQFTIKSSDANSLQKKKEKKNTQEGTEIMSQTRPKIIVTESDLYDASQRSIGEELKRSASFFMAILEERDFRQK